MSAPPAHAVVVLPARDEEHEIAAAISAIATQDPGPGRAHTIVVVDDGSTDGTRRVAERTLRGGPTPGVVVDGPGRGVGWARRVGFERAARLAATYGGRRSLLVSTDADTRPEPGWLRALLDHAAAGARVVAGDVLPREDAPPAPAGVRRRRAARAEGILALVRDEEDPRAEHHHFAAANLAIDLATYERLGELPAPSALEDEALLHRLRGLGVPVVRSAAAVVRTSPRTDGRTTHGLSTEMAIELWRERRRHHHREFDLDRLADLARDGPSVTVIIPAREEAATIGRVLDVTVAPLVERGIVDEVVVVDRHSPDGTAAVAEAHGARVVQRDDVRPELGRGLGKGDGMWRGLQRTSGEVVAFLDADTRDPTPAHLAGLLGPLLADPDVRMVRGTYRRDRLAADGTREAHGGGRVTELCARPLLALHRPRLAAFSQPLAGEFAARRDLLERLPFPVGYGVEIATLIDAEALVGLDAMAEVDLGTRQNRHRPLRELSPMAFAVHAALHRRVAPGAALPSGLRVPWRDDGPLRPPIAERPPIRDLGAEAPPAASVTRTVVDLTPAGAGS